jgi:predicted helicase
MMKDFDALYVLDLGGNVRKNPKLSGSTHNVFGIQLGVSINLFIRKLSGADRASARVFYARVGEFWRKEEKYAFLERVGDWNEVEWRELHPTTDGRWLTEGLDQDFGTFLAIGSKAAKRGIEKSIFQTYCNGAKSNSDPYVYRFNEEELRSTYREMVDAFNAQLDRWRRAGRPDDIDSFLQVDEHKLKWIRHTKRHLARNKEAAFEVSKIRTSLYRPFTQCTYVFDPAFNEDLYQLPEFFPAGRENTALCMNMTAERPFACIATSVIPNLVVAGGFGCTTQCFPFYIYDDNGDREENITDWALDQFRSHYENQAIAKWDIFYYVYAVLHHPTYRQRYAENLKRELPRLPFASEFEAFVRAGERLLDLHVNYEQQREYKLEEVEKSGEQLDLRVERMRLAADKTTIVYNNFLTLKGIPPETDKYRIGNRSALEWILDQYQISTDVRSGITNDPNRVGDPRYILVLIGKVITVSLETSRIVGSLPDLIV